MRQIIRLFIFFVPFVCSLNVWSQEDTTQKNLVVGSDIPKSNSCKDSCIIVYKKYTVITKAHGDLPGEDIVVIYDSSKSRLNIDVKAYFNIQYFQGLVADKVIIDAGTSVRRKNYIYDLKKQCVIDSMEVVLIEDPKISDGKLYYTKVMTEDRIKKLHLPPCNYTNMEFNGWVEYMYYDLMANKTISLEKYECIK
jgi:hypothetical protein